MIYTYLNINIKHIYGQYLSFYHLNIYIYIIDNKYSLDTQSPKNSL